MTNNHILTVEWTPDGHGDEDIKITADCTPNQTWEAVILILVTHVRGGTGMSENAALRAVIPAVEQAVSYTHLTLPTICSV